MADRMTEQPHPGQANRTVRIWDLPTRLFHWLLVLLLIVSWVSAENDAQDIHATSGYLLAGLLLFRLCWGLVGSRTSRFADFVRGPRSVLAYLASMGRGTAPRWHGHNPAGGVMVVVLLLAVAAQVGTGLFANDDILFEGPLRQFVSDDLSATLTGLHHRIFNILLALAIVHVTAALLYWVAKRDNLILPMITGRANLPAGPDKPMVNNWLGLAVLLALTAATYLVLDALQPF
ncbi:MAG: cytochrome b/b6 domain-containing protein [Sneathiellaceae bacterium]